MVLVLRIAAGALAGTHFCEAQLREAAQDPALVATEVADYLVAQGIPFREAHEIVGKVVRAADQDGKSIREIPLERLRQFSPVFGAELGTVLTLESALARRGVAGGTAPGAVRAALEDFTSRLARLEENS
jgi:argininosuccinate lyase